MPNPSPQPSNLVICPINCWFYPNTDGDSVNYSLPIREAEVIRQTGTFDVLNGETGNIVAMQDGTHRAHVRLTVNGITGALLGGILGMTSSDNGLDLYHEDDVAMSSGVGALTGTVKSRFIYVQDENGKYLNWQSSGTPSLGSFTASGTTLTCDSSVDGVNYTAKYLADDSSSSDSDRYAVDMTREFQRTFALQIVGLVIDPKTGEPFYDSSDSDKLSVAGIYVDKFHPSSDVPLFYASRGEHTWDLEGDAWVTQDSDLYSYLVALTASPTS